MRRRVFFEHLHNAHWPLVAWHVARGDQVFVFDFHFRLKRTPWIKALINRQKVQRIYIRPYSGADSVAMDAVERLYPRFADHPLIRACGRVFGEAEVALVFKKAMLDSVFQYCYMHRHLQQYVAQLEPDARVLIVPEMYEAWDRVLQGSGFPPLEHLERHSWSRRLAWLAATWDRVWKQEALCLYNSLLLLWAWCAKRFSPAKPGLPLAGDHVYAIDQPFQTQFQGGRKFNFLLDGTRLNKANTVFLVHQDAAGPWMAEAKATGHRVLTRAELSSPLSYWQAPPTRLPIQALLGLTFRTLGRLADPSWITWTAAAGTKVVIEDAVLFERLKVRNYIYTNSAGRIQRWHNLMVRRMGGQSWCFALAIGGGYVYSEGHARARGHWMDKRSRAYAFDNHDHLIAQSQQMISYHWKHPQAVRGYHNVGNLWSELARQARRAGRDQQLIQQWFGDRATGRKIISWFDTSFVEADGSVSTFKDAIAWYEDILRFLKERDDVCMIIKPSKAEAWFADSRHQWFHPLGVRVVELWRQLQAHPRVYFAGHQGDPSDIMAASDLVVTFCFSSPTAEALGARARAIWYDPGQRWRDTLYGEEPLLVAHGFDELMRVSGLLLHRMSDFAYQQFLDERVSGLVEDHLDGQGLSRFRALLVEALAGGERQTGAATPEAVLIGDGAR